MRNSTTVILLFTILCGCSDNKAVEKSVLDSVIAVHNTIMNAEGHLQHNIALLDSLPQNKTIISAKRHENRILRRSLQDADDAMDKWMHNFRYDQSGMSGREVLDYLRHQKKQITAIDSQFNAAIDASDKYLKQIKSK